MRRALLAAVLVLSACGASRSPEQAIAAAAAARPADERLAGLYENSCRGCHAAPDSGAPLTLDRAAWNPRWSKGEATLIEHTIGGFNGMPAGGQCFTCTAEDYRALIAFMAAREE